jgi:hypothetical protein
LIGVFLVVPPPVALFRWRRGQALVQVPVEEPAEALLLGPHVHATVPGYLASQIEKFRADVEVVPGVYCPRFILKTKTNVNDLPTSKVHSRVNLIFRATVYHTQKQKVTLF